MSMPSHSVTKACTKSCHGLGQARTCTLDRHEVCILNFEDVESPFCVQNMLCDHADILVTACRQAAYLQHRRASYLWYPTPKKSRFRWIHRPWSTLWCNTSRTTTDNLTSERMAFHAENEAPTCHDITTIYGELKQHEWYSIITEHVLIEAKEVGSVSRTLWGVSESNQYHAV